MVAFNLQNNNDIENAIDRRLQSLGRIFCPQTFLLICEGQITSLSEKNLLVLKTADGH